MYFLYFMMYFYSVLAHMHHQVFFARVFELDLLNLQVEYEECEDNKVYIVHKKNSFLTDAFYGLDMQDKREGTGSKLILYDEIAGELCKKCEATGGQVQFDKHLPNLIAGNARTKICGRLDISCVSNKDELKHLLAVSEHHKCFYKAFNSLGVTGIFYDAYNEAIKTTDTIREILSNQDKKSVGYRKEYNLEYNNYNLAFFGRHYNHCIDFFKGLKHELEKESNECIDSGEETESVYFKGLIAKNYVEHAMEHALIKKSKDFDELTGVFKQHVYFLCLFLDVINLSGLVKKNDYVWQVFDFCIHKPHTAVSPIDSIVIKLFIKDEESELFVKKQKIQVSDSKKKIYSAKSFISSDQKILHIVLDKKNARLTR